MAVNEPLCQQTTLFKAGDLGYMSFRIPALVRSTTGTVLAFAEGRKDGRGDFSDIDMALRRSLDGGKTWGPINFIVDDGDHTMGNPCPVVDAATGEIFLLLCRDNRQVLLTSSTDDGQSWALPEDISTGVMDSRFYFVFTGPGHGIQLSTGRLIAPCSADYRKRIGDEQGSFVVYSDDHGRSWKIGGALTRDASDECEAVELADGTIYMNMRSRGNKRLRAYAYSSDGGETWSEVAYHADMPESSCQGSVIRFTDVGSHGKNRIILAHQANPYGRAQLTLRMSYDESKSWPVAKILYEGSAAYSDLVTNLEGEILCFYEADDYTRMPLALLNVEWLTDGADSLSVAEA